ncbi:hypothetical protein K2173_000879 [Erythroxylum novogranatense]|uniref:Uncharacterized protein n=1 Tax=Erythroxylum novogranatense TaxID=1862640 RepID=A0AAV8TSP3_9ROSI|nr:hypothetical protein K2173_000879 [Erythroxylum novogranatense]
MVFENFEPIFGEPKAEWAKNSDSSSFPLRRFLMHVFAQDYYSLRLHVTDFYSSTFEAVKSVDQLEDMRDSTGIGGSWSEFVDYIIASIRSEDVKLVLDGRSNLDGAAHAKLVAQKSKGMPVITISFTRVAGPAASDAMAAMSFGLYNTLKGMQKLVSQGEEHSSDLRKVIPAENERKENIEAQSEKRHEIEKMIWSSKAADSASVASNSSHDSPGKRSTRDRKVTNRVVPTYRRTKVRGALLQDTEDDNDN